MRKLVISFIAVSLICALQVTLGHASYDADIQVMWHEALEKRGLKQEGAFLPHDIKNYLKTRSLQMAKGERLLIAFYPRHCTFDNYVKDRSSFIKSRDFIALTKNLNFKIIASLPQKHIARFDSHKELTHFIFKKFNTQIAATKCPLLFATTLVFAELEKI